jgi:hypothetical protein
MFRCLSDRTLWASAALIGFVGGCGPVGHPPADSPPVVRQHRFPLEAGVWALASSADGKMLATVDGPGVPRGLVRLRDLSTGRELSHADPAVGHPQFVTFSPDGSRLAVVYDTWRLDLPPFRIQLWDVTADGKLSHLRVLDPDAPYSTRTVHAVAFAPGGDSLVAGTAQEVIYVWDAATGQVRRRFQGGVAAGFAPDGRTLIAVTHDGEVRRFETVGWQLLGRPKPPRQSDFLYVAHAVFASDGRRVALSDDWTTLVKDLDTNQTLCRLHLPTGAVPLSFSLDGNLLAVAGAEGTHFFDPTTGTERSWLKRADGPGQFLRDGTYLARSEEKWLVLHDPDDVLAGADKAPPLAATDPPGVPLEAELIARQDTYTLDLEGDAPEDFSTRIQFGDPFPEPPRVSLVLKLRNTGQQNITLRYPDDGPMLFLVGAGAMNHAWEGKQTGVVVGPAKPGPLTLAPGASHAIPVRELNRDGFAFWLLPGEYRVAGRYAAMVSPAPKGSRDAGEGFGYVEVRFAPAAVNVLSGTTPPTAHRLDDGHVVRRPLPPGSVIVPKVDDGSDEIRDRLAKPVKLREGVAAGTPLEDILDHLGRRYDLDIRIDQKAFENAGNQGVGRKKTWLPALENVALDTVLQVLLDQVDARLEVRGRTVWILPPAGPQPLVRKQACPPRSRGEWP